ncbi:MULTISPECIES: AMP-dependent synthetase/ligase [Kitasatospora]|uniref:Putative long-chain fatty-acid--CoA ligase n=1 Tax=Kitasatospora setae (strain ATCC 33774 / DSM 43861 / JCM 3304 / KCC A-0304 / NBRC 14216 / KM-6054) TaxID=452652 RepID=E4N8L2_KITSK|nr:MULTISPECIES: AMP-dependent synthetase/ligase [Kitasatospora]BAJ27543.1 putative long-chain fatty-acid--CoA ligase [Kitasatospora setae KM-6054]
MAHPLARAARSGRLAPPPVEVRRAGGRVVEARAAHLVPPPDRGSLADLPFRNAEQAPDAVVLTIRQGDGSWRDVTARAFADRVAALARGLIAVGVRPGARLVLMARTRYEWTLLDFAAWAAGACVVPVYPTSSVEQAEWIVRDSAPVLAVAEDAGTAEALAVAIARTGGRVPLWRLDEDALDRLAGLGAAVPAEELVRRRAALGPDDEATLIYTSGTTGRPKGCRLTHGNFLTEAANCHALLEPVFAEVTGEPPRTLLFLPLAHVLGRMIQVTCVYGRIRIGHSPSLKPAELRPDLASFGATFLVGVPYLFEKIHQLGRAEAQAKGAVRVFDRAAAVAVRYARAELAALAGEGRPAPPALRLAHRLYDALVYRRVRAAMGGRVRYAISGGSSIDPELLLFFAGAGVLVYEGYGLTESSGPSTVNPPLRPRPGTVGPPVPGGAVRIAADGEVFLSGGQVFDGYHEPGAPRRPRPGPEWFATGDLGRLDEDGYLTITGRKKEILVTSGGKNVSPGPLEDRLRAHPLISQALVVGNGRPYVAALLTLDPEAVEHFLELRPRTGPAEQPGGGSVDIGSAVPVHHAVLTALAEAVRAVNSTVSRAESIRRIRVVAGDFTEERGLLTPSLKVRRQAVGTAYRRDIEQLYA